MEDARAPEAAQNSTEDADTWIEKPDDALVPQDGAITPHACRTATPGYCTGDSGCLGIAGWGWTVYTCRPHSIPWIRICDESYVEDAGVADC